VYNHWITSGQANRIIIAGLTEFERNLISDRVKSGLASAWGADLVRVLEWTDLGARRATGCWQPTTSKRIGRAGRCSRPQPFSTVGARAAGSFSRLSNQRGRQGQQFLAVPWSKSAAVGPAAGAISWRWPASSPPSCRCTWVVGRRSYTTAGDT